MKIVVLLFVALILYFLGSGLYYLMKDKGHSARLARSLTWRIGLSIALFVLLLAGYRLGFNFK